MLSFGVFTLLALENINTTEPIDLPLFMGLFCDRYVGRIGTRTCTGTAGLRLKRPTVRFLRVVAAFSARFLWSCVVHIFGARFWSRWID